MAFAYAKQIHVLGPDWHMLEPNLFGLRSGVSRNDDPGGCFSEKEQGDFHKLERLSLAGESDTVPSREHSGNERLD